MSNRKILVTGASIAGPALAYWLARHGMDVTVVERSPQFRDGGQTIDVRGAGRTVIQKMGLEETLRANTTHEAGIAFVDEDDRIKAKIGADAFGGEGPVAGLEILRGEFGRILIAHCPETVVFRFGDRIAEIRDTGQTVEVRFEQGGEETYDLVIAAEGIGSHTRRLVFGDEVKRRSFDLYTAYFTIPRGPTDGNLFRWFNAPGGFNVNLRPDNLGTTRALLSFQEPPSGYEKLSIDAQKQLLKTKFAGIGWETPRILAALDATPDFYLEAIGQVRMDRWSKGRIAMVGDAAYCASPISGMGTSLALCGAYILAGELARHDDHALAFAAYETLMRPYVEQAQDVPTFAPRLASPHSRLGIAIGHAVLKLATAPGFGLILGKFLSPKADAIVLPEY
ncbi:MAG: FAD-dependent monooxygenase [Janthinobacterium lividum]